MEGGAEAADSLRRNYRVGKTLGHGSFGKVKIAEHIRTGLKVAIKILNRRRMGSPDMEEKGKSFASLRTIKNNMYKVSSNFSCKIFLFHGNKHTRSSFSNWFAFRHYFIPFHLR